MYFSPVVSRKLSHYDVNKRKKTTVVWHVLGYQLNKKLTPNVCSFFFGGGGGFKSAVLSHPFWVILEL